MVDKAIAIVFNLGPARFSMSRKNRGDAYDLAWWLTILLALVCAPAFAHAATLTLHVQRVGPAGGVLRVAVYDRASYTGRNGKPVASRGVPATPGETTVVVPDIPPGRYAVKTFQDEENRGEMKFNFIGIPVWRYGFSNDAKPGLAQPDFEEAAFNLPASGATLTIHLR